MVWQMTKIPLRKAMGAIAALAVAVPVWSCASTEAYLGDVPSDRVLTPADDAGGGDASSVDGGMCIATECPEGLTTCPSEFGPTYKCSVDLRRDQKHCGACGHECIMMEPNHMSSRCVDGACLLECMSPPRYVASVGDFVPTSFENCNGILDDGCEIDVLSDSDNCGACGHACPGGKACINGQCGCPTGLDACGEWCTDTSEDDANCGWCGHFCEDPDPVCDPMPENTSYGCSGGDCGQLKCLSGTADCDGDLGLVCASNGCETSLVDPNNCGACNNKCKADEQCSLTELGIQCVPTCEKQGLTACEGGFCVDILNHPENCGGCELACPTAGPNQTRSCKKGVCEVECAEGFGDCNGDPSDGCEADLRAHPQHCGACGASCNVALGQPCVEGKCLMQPCEGEATR